MEPLHRMHPTGAMMEDAVARAVHAVYASLPKTGKPQPGEWTVLAGIVLLRPGAAAKCVALGTGTKCLTTTQIAADASGESVHDAHAEVCARRALRAYLLAEIRAAALSESIVLQPIAGGGGFEVKPGVQLVMYTSEPPCGDAAIFDALVDGARVVTTDDATVVAERTPKRPRTANDCGDSSSTRRHAAEAAAAMRAAAAAAAAAGSRRCCPRRTAAGRRDARRATRY